MAVASPIVPNASQAVAAARAALAEALVLKVGQVLEALVVGKTPDGLTALKIGDQVVTAKLPQLNLVVGATLQLQVKVAGSSPQLQVVTAPAPTASTPAPATPMPTAAKPSVPMPAVQQVGADHATAAERPVVQVTPSLQQTPVAVAAKPESGQSVTVSRSETASTPVLPNATASEAGAAAPTQRQSSTVVVAAGPTEVQLAKSSVPSPLAVAAPQLPPTSAPASKEPPAVSATPMSAPAAVESARATVSAAPPNGPVSVAAEAVTPSSATLPATSSTATPATGSASPPSTLSQPALEGQEPAAPNPLLLAQSVARPQATVADLPRAVVAAQPTAAPQPLAPQTPPLPTTPQAALAQMLPEALGRQDSAGALLMSLAAVVQKPGLLPEPILRAALGVLAQRIIVSDGKVQAGQIEQAVARSGVMLEASLLRAELQPRDAKAGLLALREGLSKWLGGTPVPTVSGREPAPPPIKGLPLRAVPLEPPPLPDAAKDVGRLLHSETDAAVSRIKLMQLASLPDSDPGKPSVTALRMELPFLIGHELVMAQIQVGRDGTRREAERKRGWTMRFALNFSQTGEVGAEVGVLGKAVNVSLWAAEPETAVAMKETLPELTRSLEAVGLKPGSVRIRHGVAIEPQPPASGRLLDSIL